MPDLRRAGFVASGSVLVLMTVGCEASPVSVPEPDLSPSQAVMATDLIVEGPILLPGHDRPRAINNRGWVLTPFSLIDGGSTIQLAPAFWPEAMNQTTVVGSPNRQPQDCPVAATLDPKSGTATTLSTPAGYDGAVGIGINGAGVVLGWAGRRNASPLCEILHQSVVLWHDGIPLLLPPTHDGESALPHAINDRGDVAGMSGTDATVWRGGKPVAIGRLGGRESRAMALNDRGLVVGFSETDETLQTFRVTRAFSWENGVMTVLESLGGDSSFARAVNNAGLIAGSSSDALLRERAVVWHGGRVFDLGTLGGPRSTAYAVNDRGEIAGWAEDENGYGHTVMWRVRLSR